MSTLVIHPLDYTTRFLNLIYEDKNFDVINDPDIQKDSLKQLIKDHDRIIMMGHGSPEGLFNPNRSGYIINDEFAPLFKDKETISIWCYSNLYFKRFGISGLHTGMIISDIEEEYDVLERVPLSSDALYRNMVLLSKSISDCIDLKNPYEMKDYILEHYVGNDLVTIHNRKNIIVL